MKGTWCRLSVDFIAGTTPQEAADSMSALARKLDVVVFTGFNGVEMTTYPNVDPCTVVELWKRELELQRQVRSIHTPPCPKESQL